MVRFVRTIVIISEGIHVSEYYASSIRLWVENKCALDESGRVSVSAAYRDYLDFHGFPEWPNPRGVGISRNRFSRELRRILGERVTTVKSGIKYFRGIRFNVELGITTDIV